MHTSLIFFVLLEFMHFCDKFEVCVHLPLKLLCFFPHDFSSVLRGHLRKDFLLEFLFPVIHTDVVALHYIENSY